MNLSLEEILSLLKIFHKSQFSTNITSPKNLFMNQFHIFQPRTNIISPENQFLINFRQEQI